MAVIYHLSVGVEKITDSGETVQKKKKKRRLLGESGDTPTMVEILSIVSRDFHQLSAVLRSKSFPFSAVPLSEAVRYI